MFWRIPTFPNIYVCKRFILGGWDNLDDLIQCLQAFSLFIGSFLSVKSLNNSGLFFHYGEDRGERGEAN